MNVSSTLDAVTVYAKGAVCTRKAKVAGAGKRQLRITGLPLSLLPGSLRAQVHGDAAARVLDVRPGYDVELPAEADVPVEQKALEAAQTEVNRLTVELQRVERELGELSKLKPVFPAAKPGEPPRTAPVEALLKAAEFVSQELSKRFETRRKLTEAFEDARNELELRKKRLAEASASVRTQRARLTRVAVVTLSEGAADVELSVEYFVPGARWAPSYALRLDAGMAKGTLSMRAAVAQASGEDWSGVKLSLSTAALDRRTALPELKSLRLGRAQPTPKRSGWRDPPPGLDELFQGFDSVWRTRPAQPRPPAPPPMVPPLMPSPVAAAGPPMKRDKPRRTETGEVMVAAPAPRNLPPPQSAPAAPGSGMVLRQSLTMSSPSLSRQRKPAPKGRGFLPSFGDGADDSDSEPMMDEMSEGGAYENDKSRDEPPAEAIEPVPSLEPGAALLDYASLTMAAPGPGRGRLQATHDPGMVLLAQLHLEASVAVKLIGMPTIRAQGIEDLALPPRAHAPDGGSFDYRYDCVARVDVPSAEGWTLVPVADADVGLTAEYACVPSVEPQVYRTLKLHNRSKHALLRGPVDVTLGDEFLLTADLPLIAPGARDARLGLGVEEAIKVARKTHFKETTGGLLGGSTLLPHDLEIEVNNRLAFPARLEVRERVPVSLDDDVKIEEAKVEPAWEKDEGPRDGVSVRGARAWRITVPPGQKLTLTAQYVVRIPSDKMVVGGNRRA